MHVAFLSCLQQCGTRISSSWPPLTQTKSVLCHYVAIYDFPVTLFDDNFAIHILQVKPFDDTEHSHHQVVLLNDA